MISRKVCGVVFQLLDFVSVVALDLTPDFRLIETVAIIRLAVPAGLAFDILVLFFINQPELF